MVVTIDGPAGAGKSTVAEIVGGKTNLRYINSGNIYRAVTFGLFMYFQDELLNVLENNREKIFEVVQQFSFKISGDAILLNGKIIQDEDIRNDKVDSYVATLSSIPELRNWTNTILRNISQKQSIIVEGRDMSTVAFPDAELKIYLDANIETRSLRRYKQGSSKLNLEKIRGSIQERDKIDREKEVGSLKLAPDARYLDTSDLTVAQVSEIIVKLIHKYEDSRSKQIAMAGKEQQISAPTRQEELQEEYLKSLDELEVGQLIQGKVVAVTTEHAFVDVGYKSEGKISLDQFDQPPKDGDTVQVVLINKEGRNGEVVVSKQKADERIIWKEIKNAYQSDSAIEGTGCSGSEGRV